MIGNGLGGRIGRAAAGLLAAIALCVLLLAAPTSALEFPRGSPDYRYVGKLESAILAFQNARGRWPRNLADLRRYVRESRHGVNLSRFASLKLTPKPGNTLLVEYTIGTKNPRTGIFAITVVRVVP